MEQIRANLRWIIIAAGVIVLVGLSGYIGGCRSGQASGFDAGFANGYKKGLTDSSCDGGTHYRPFPQR